MANVTETQRLGLSTEVKGFLQNLVRERKDVGISRKIFNFPSVGTTFSRVTHTVGQNVEYYFVKEFDPTYFQVETPKPLPWKRGKTILAPAVLEQIYLEAYRNEGCAVPECEVIDDFTIAMEDCGIETLEERLRDKTSKQQEDILAELIADQVKIAIAGRKIKIPSNATDRVEQYSDLDKDFGLHYNFWRPGGTVEEKAKFLEDTKFFRRQTGRKQYFIGDSATFHILFKPTGEYKTDGTPIARPMWVDLERLKEGEQAREMDGIYFSPECSLGVEAIERLLFLFKSIEEETEKGEIRREKYVDPKNFKNYLKEFYRDGIVECFRRATKIRELQTTYSDVYDSFVTRHQGFKDAFQRYRERIGGITVKAKINGLYDEREKEAFQRGGDAIFDLISK